MANPEPAAPSLPSATQIADAWSRVLVNGVEAIRATAGRAASPATPPPFDPSGPARAMAAFGAGMLADPIGLVQAQQAAWSEWSALWRSAGKRLLGGAPEPVATPARGDRRFNDPAWSEQPAFDTLKQAYLLASRQIEDAVANLGDLDPATRTRVDFYTRQYLYALSPANFAFTNPRAIRQAIDSGGMSLLSGLANLLADAATPAGLVQRRSSEQFELGRDLAATPGSVVFQNELMQLIQYAPATDTVFKRPLLYVPPLVNKYYLLDLLPKQSLIKWLVDEGHTVFVISWVNPGAELRDKGLSDYIVEGPLAALDAIRDATGEEVVDLFAFCMGGTLVTIALGLLAARGEGERVRSATLIGSMLDFSAMGEWGAFTDPGQLAAFEKHLDATGFIGSHHLQTLFSVVRANDLIWSSVVNHYLLDREAPPSDILYWFADGAHITRAFLLDYTGRLLRDNALATPGAVEVDGAAIDLATVAQRMMFVSLKDDHVSGWEATYQGAKLVGGEVRFLLGGSGHNAGVINPPSAGKHGYWTNAALPDTAEEWLAGAEQKPGSWWTEWQHWLSDDDRRLPARAPGDGKLTAIEPAPGSYVRKRD